MVAYQSDIPDLDLLLKLSRLSRCDLRHLHCCCSSPTKPMSKGGAFNMCRVQYFKAERCRHAWILLRQPCQPGRDLSNCPQFQDGCTNEVARLPPFMPRLRAPPGSCPVCNLCGIFNERTMRMVLDERSGIRFGCGPSESSPGFDCFCVVM
jgi:hypothetical protein